MNFHVLKFTLVSLAILLHIFPTPTYSTSRKALDVAKSTRIGFRVSLKHIDHGSNFTKLERVQRGIKRGSYRLQKLNAMVLDSTKGPFDVESKIHPGNGEFLMNIAIGTPPNQYSAIMDTGSDLVWTQCQPCQDCFDQSSPIFNPKKSSSFNPVECSSQLCQVLPTSTCNNGCEYLYTYGDYSSSQGILATETFTFGSGSDKVSVPNIGFGCGEDNEGDGFNQGAGLVGLGRGPLSLVSQLDEPKFSYCLTSIDGSKSSTLLMGSLAATTTSSLSEKSSKNASVITTPLLKNPSQPSFYYLHLEGISVGGSRLPIKEDTFALSDDGSGGLIIDSGTTITYLEQSAFRLLKQEFASQMKLPVDRSRSTGLDLCFKMPKDTSSIEVPKLVFHFKGAADLELPSENYMIGDPNTGIVCLAMGASTGMSIFGNVQQQNLMVVHDLAKETLSFIPTKCDGL